MNKFLRSLNFAFKGFSEAFKSELNLKIHLSVTFITVAAGLLLHLSLIEWGLIIFSIALVISAELMNTSIEVLTDLISPEYSRAAGKVKDIAAAAVLVTAVAAVLVAILIFYPKLAKVFFC